MLKRKSAFTLVEIMIVVAIIALLASVAIPNLVRSKITAGDASAKATLKAIASAMETYYATHNAYPNDVALLIGDVPPYLSKDYFTGFYNGFSYNTDVLNEGDYEVTATPKSSIYGTQSITVSTGAIFTN